jgi:adenosylcobinamide-GDP ribazoletransferase
MGRSTVFFPLIGLLIGLVLAGVNFLLSYILPSSIINVILIAGLAVLSGGLHLDGLADTIDGTCGSRSPEKRLEIMRDSRIGSIGAVGLTLVLLIQFIALNSIPDEYRTGIIILAPVLSRWAMVNAIFVYPYARPEGLGKIFKGRLFGLEYALDAVASILLCLILFKLAGIVIMAAIWLTADISSILITRKIGGMTGDTYGAVNEFVVLAVFLIMSLLAFNGWLL